MRIRLYTFSASGGAGNVTRALADGFRTLGHDVDVTSHTNFSIRQEPLRNKRLTLAALADNSIMKSSKWDSLISHSRDRRQIINPIDFSADLTVFRWMNGMLGDLLHDDVTTEKPISWGLADMNPFTSVCHYSNECENYTVGCSMCPAVRTIFRRGVEQHFEWKRQIIEKLQPVFVSPTDWMWQKAKSASLTKRSRIEKILNPLPFEFFSEVIDKRKSDYLGVLVVAARLDDRVKGVWREVETLNRLSKNSRINLTMIGLASERLKQNMPEVSFLGHLRSQEVMREMDANDILLVPSLEENAGTVVAEAASRGLPAIARRVGGMPEMTNYGQSGYLFSSSEELIDIFQSLEFSEILSKGQMARDWSIKLRPDKVALEHLRAHSLG